MDLHRTPAQLGPAGPPAEDYADDLVTAHARSLERAVAGEFERQTRRTPFATPVQVVALAVGLLREFGEDLLNDLLMMAERLPAPARGPWAVIRLSEALIEGADALEEVSPPALRERVSCALQICRVDLEWRCRMTLGLPSPTGTGESDLFDRGGLW